jgi:hypothetical protein
MKGCYHRISSLSSCLSRGEIDNELVNSLKILSDRIEKVKQDKKIELKKMDNNDLSTVQEYAKTLKWKLDNFRSYIQNEINETALKFKKIIEKNIKLEHQGSVFT